jgi:CO dehydrogenase maturation factor
MRTIAVSGKGGTGKTTISAFIVRWLNSTAGQSVLAVDADPNVNLNDVLGVEIRSTIGSIREEMRASVSDLPGGMTKQQFLEYKIQTSLKETPEFDLLAMGRPEGPGCYCYANNLLRDILAALSRNYVFVVIDNEAGMEHLSRRTTQKIDDLLIVSDPSVRGIRAAGRISRLLHELETRVGAKHLLLNRCPDVLPAGVSAAAEETGLPLLGTIPEDPVLLDLDRSGQALWPAGRETRAFRSLDRCLSGLRESEHWKEAHHGV